MPPRVFVDKIYTSTSQQNGSLNKNKITMIKRRAQIKAQHLN